MDNIYLNTFLLKVLLETRTRLSFFDCLKVAAGAAFVRRLSAPTNPKNRLRLHPKSGGSGSSTLFSSIQEHRFQVSEMYQQPSMCEEFYVLQVKECFCFLTRGRAGWPKTAPSLLCVCVWCCCCRNITSSSWGRRAGWSSSVHSSLGDADCVALQDRSERTKSFEVFNCSVNGPGS